MRSSRAICGIIAATISHAGWAAADEAGSSAAEPGAEATPADEKVVCIAAFDQAQRLRNASQYLLSQQQLLKCANPACGDALMSECTEMYSQLEAAIPSIVLSARDAGKGTDLNEVEVSIDGKPLVHVLDGRPIPLDPGDYELTFTAPDLPPMERRVVIRTGEKYRQISIEFPAPPSAAPLPNHNPILTMPPPGEAIATSRSVPAMSYVLGGLSLVGFGAFATLRIIGSSDFNTLKEGCAPGCPESDVSNLKQKYLFSNIALGVGAAALTGAVVFYIAAPSRPESANVAIGLSPAGDGPMARARGTF